MRYFLKALLWTAAFQVAGCAANVNSDGSCKRTCGSRPIGGGKLKAYTLGNTDHKWTCTVGGADIPQQTFEFMVVEETSSGSGEYDPKEDIPKTIPVAGISVAPKDFPITTSGDLDTPSSEWCTDSCGVASFSFTPKCMKQDIMATVDVRGLVADGTTMPSIKFTVTTEE